MNYKIISTQPQIYDSFLQTSLIARAQNKKIIKMQIYNLHDFAFDKYKSIDDTPYGGGAGMVIRFDIVFNAISKLKRKTKNEKLKTKILLLTPQGKKFTQKDAKRLAKEKELILIAGRFEGYDERIRAIVSEEISIGDYVLTNGDLPAMVLINAISRHIPGFIEKSESIKEESFSPLKIALEYPQYTKPFEYRGKKVPKILLSGDHQKIAQWRAKKSIERTKKSRPDLLK
jgi:tRNA (guanine37-N1)-methyltransferase